MADKEAAICSAVASSFGVFFIFNIVNILAVIFALVNMTKVIKSPYRLKRFFQLRFVGNFRPIDAGLEAIR